MTVEQRRQALLEWFYADEERNGWGTCQIAGWSTYWPGPVTGSARWIYPSKMKVARHRAYRDLKALERRGDITRGQSNGRATWWYA